MANERCNYCGATTYKPHKKYTDRCEDCGKRYNRFMALKSQCSDDFGNVDPNRGLYKVINEYEALMVDGYRVPKYIRERNK